MAPEHHGTNIVRLIHVVLVLENTVDPARNRNTFQVHQALCLAVLAGDAVEASFNPLVVFAPYTRPVLPGTCGQAVIAGQRVRENTEVGGALNVVVAAEDVCTATGDAHVSESQLQRAVGTGVVVTVGVLRTTHAPDEGAGAVVGHQLGYTLQLRARHAGYTLGFLRGPFCDLGLNILHPVNALTDEFLVFPAVLEDVPHDTPNQTNVRTRTEAHIFISMRCRAREARVTNDQRCVVLLLRLQQVKQRNRVCFGRVAADHENRT